MMVEAKLIGVGRVVYLFDHGEIMILRECLVSASPLSWQSKEPFSLGYIKGKLSMRYLLNLIDAF
jgi:hypothetical protein